MKKPNNYANTTTESKKLPAGGYICKIVACKETESKAGKPMLKIALEILEGEHRGFFAELWRDRKMAAFPNEAKYPNEGTAYILTEDYEGNCSKSFKGFCTALEDSGNIVWNAQDELADLTGAVVGVLFRREENEYEGRTFWQTKPFSFRSVDRIRKGDYTVPEDKPLTQSAQPGSSYQQGSYQNSYQGAYQGSPYESVKEDIPF